MAITKEEVRKLAELSRLKLTTEEETRFAATISAVLDYMKILNEVDTTGIDPTAQVTGLQNVTRADVVKSSTLGSALVNTMPRVQNGELVVPAVLEN